MNESACCLPHIVSFLNLLDIKRSAPISKEFHSAVQRVLLSWAKAGMFIEFNEKTHFALFIIENDACLAKIGIVHSKRKFQSLIFDLEFEDKTSYNLEFQRVNRITLSSQYMKFLVHRSTLFEHGAEQTVGAMECYRQFILFLKTRFPSKTGEFDVSPIYS
jgi:hypothetical protein